MKKIGENKSALQQLKERHGKEMAKMQREEAIIASLPDDLPMVPTISNIRSTKRKGRLEPDAWLSFSAPSYDPDKTYNPVAILTSLERGGFRLQSASLVKWDDYRRTVEIGLCEDILEEKPGCFGSTYKLNDIDPIAPVWIGPEQYGNAEMVCFMRHIATGEMYRVSIDLPGGVVGLCATRKEFRGGWHYERGTAKLRFPQSWHGLTHCTISQHTRAYVDTEQGLSGSIYFMPHDEQSNWPLSASEFLTELLAAK